MQLRPTVSQTLPLFTLPQTDAPAGRSHTDVCPFFIRRDRSASFRVDNIWPAGTEPQWLDRMRQTVEDAVSVPPLSDSARSALEEALHTLGCDSLPYAKLRHLGAQLHLHVETIKVLITTQRDVLLPKHSETLRRAVDELKNADELVHIIRRHAEHTTLDRATADRIEAMLPQLQQLNRDIEALLHA